MCAGVHVCVCVYANCGLLAAVISVRATVDVVSGFASAADLDDLLHTIAGTPAFMLV